MPYFVFPVLLAVLACPFPAKGGSASKPPKASHSSTFAEKDFLQAESSNFESTTPNTISTEHNNPFQFSPQGKTLLKKSPNDLKVILPQFSDPKSLFLGGNISGGGEVYRVGENCEVYGAQLVDFIQADPMFLDSFRDKQKEPFLHQQKYSVQQALQGVPLDLAKVASLTVKRAYLALDSWENNSPYAIQLIRNKLKHMRWFSTPLQFRTKLDNLATGFNFRQYYQKWAKCSSYREFPFYDFEGPIASFITGKGSILNNRLWQVTGDRSRAGVIVHETIRALQYDNRLPIQNENIHKIVAALFIESPKNKKKHYLDDLLFDFYLASRLGGVRYNKFDIPALSFACMINIKEHSIFKKKSYKEYLQKISQQIPINGDSPEQYQDKSTLEKLRQTQNSLITYTVHSLLGKKPKHLQRYKWYQPTNLIGKKAFTYYLDLWSAKTKKYCPSFRYNKNAISITPPFPAHDIAELHRSISELVRFYFDQNKVDLINPRYSPEFNLPGRHTGWYTKHINARDRGALPEAIESVGGLDNFNKINHQFTKWNKQWQADSRREFYIGTDKVPWPETINGKGSMEFILYWMKRNPNGTW